MMLSARSVISTIKRRMPSVVQVQTSTVSPGSTAPYYYSPTMPSGVTPGNLLVCIIGVANSSATDALTISSGTGWSLVSTYISTASSTAGPTTHILKKTATGSDSLTVNLDISSNKIGVAWVYEIRNADTVSLTAFSDNAAPYSVYEFPSHTAAAAQAGYLWIINGFDTLYPTGSSKRGYFSSLPSGFGSQTNVYFVYNAGGSCAVMQSMSATVDPPNVSIANPGNYQNAATIAVFKAV